MYLRPALALAATFLLAPLDAAAADAPGFARFDCEAYRRPALDLVRDAFGIANFDHAYDARASLHLVVQRACARGPRYVEVVYAPKQRAADAFRAVAAK